MIINGTDIQSYDLILTKAPPVAKPQKRVRQIVIPGRSGSLTEWSGDYEQYFKESEFLYTGNDINDALTFLRSASLAVFPNEINYAYEVRVDERINAAREPSGTYKLTVAFAAQPLKRLSDETALTGATTYSLTNPGNEPSHPKLVVTGAGSKTVTIGSQVITLAFAGGGETLTIDALNGQVYDASGNNAWSKLIGNLPFIPVSASAITISTTGTALTIYPNWRWS